MSPGIHNGAPGAQNGTQVAYPASLGRAIAGKTPPFIVGLTGGIGMGKSTVGRMLEDLGVPVLESDKVVHDLYAPGGLAVGPVLRAFPGVGSADGGVDRALLSKAVLGDPAALKHLEEVVHPTVRAMQEAWIERESRGVAGDAGTRAVPIALALDIPLLFETAADGRVDAVVVVSSGEDSQRTRCLARPGMTPEKLAAILARQVSDTERRARAHYVVDTGTSLEATRQEVERLVDLLWKAELDSEVHGKGSPAKGGGTADPRADRTAPGAWASLDPVARGAAAPKPGFDTVTYPGKGSEWAADVPGAEGAAPDTPGAPAARGAVTIRPYVESDWPRVYPVLRVVIREGETYTYPQDSSEEELHEAWVVKPDALFVAEEAVPATAPTGEATSGGDAPGEQAGAGGGERAGGFGAPGVLLGFYQLRANQPGRGSHVSNCGYVVSPAARGRGLARLMCKDSQARAAAMGFRSMQFNFVVETNAVAVALWKKLGFEVVGRLPRAFDHPKAGLVDALIMYKHLTPAERVRG